MCTNTLEWYLPWYQYRYCVSLFTKKKMFHLLWDIYHLNISKWPSEIVLPYVSCCFYTVFLYSPVYYLYWFFFYSTIFYHLKSIMPMSSAWSCHPCKNVFFFSLFFLCPAQSSNIIQTLCHFGQQPFKIKVTGVWNTSSIDTTIDPNS